MGSTAIDNFAFKVHMPSKTASKERKGKKSEVKKARKGQQKVEERRTF
jgi:hypothetical protein